MRNYIAYYDWSSVRVSNLTSFYCGKAVGGKIITAMDKRRARIINTEAKAKETLTQLLAETEFAWKLLPVFICKCTSCRKKYPSDLSADFDFCADCDKKLFITAKTKIHEQH